MDIEAPSIKTDFEKFYRTGRTMGQGAFATVKMCTNISEKTQWAVKIVKKSAISKEDKENLQSEIDIMGRIHHPHIVSLKEVYENKQHVYFVMELMTGGELFDRIVSKEHYSEKEAKHAMFQIVSAIQHCHDMDVVHRYGLI